MSIYTPILKANPKAKPLAQTLIAAAAEQGANMEELRVACDLAQRAYRKARDESVTKLTTPLKGKAEAALERI